MVGRRVRCAQCGETVVVSKPQKLVKGAEATKSAPAPGGVSRWTEPASPPPVSAEPIDLKVDREDIEADMDMTPMVDVTFLLLIFFMVTAAFAMQKSIEIPKPNQEEASTTTVQVEPEDDPNFVTVFVDEFDCYKVITVDWDVEAPSQQDLRIKLEEARRGDSAGNIPTKLLVKAHGDSHHGTVVAALDAGTAVGMEQVQLVTVEESE